MPNLKDIRRRIRSVKSTQKITQAMKMVAAAKVKRAENRVKANRPYASELVTIFRGVYETMKNQAALLDGSRYGELLTERPVKKAGIIVITSDRGLCGSYNASIIKQALNLDKTLQAQGITPKFFLVGNKIIRSFKNYTDSEVLGQVGNISAAPTAQDASLIGQQLFHAYQSGEIDAVHILYTRFISMISYKVTLKPIFPLKGLIEEIEHAIAAPPEMYESDLHPTSHGTLRAETLLEPSPTAVLDTLVPLYLTNQLYNALLEGSASELAARMTAMSNASNNATEMIGRLTIQYNKARQAAITQEILEIVGGAEAL
jgi:F-type H+-transporting ATPase subunit gamma